MYGLSRLIHLLTEDYNNDVWMSIFQAQSFTKRHQHDHVDKKCTSFCNNIIFIFEYS